MEYVTFQPRKSWRVDRHSFLWLPAGIDHSQSSVSTVYDVFGFFPSAPLLAKILRKIPVRRHSVLTRVHVSRRSRLLSELLEEYFTLRIDQRSSPSATSRLYLLAIEEMARLLTRCEPGQTDQKFRPRDELKPDSPVRRVVRCVEANLFMPLSVRNIARLSGVSMATLYRLFETELGCTPFELVRRRRLEEARALLETGEQKVETVALLVGYAEATAFSKAFRAEFGLSPSKCRQRAVSTTFGLRRLPGTTDKE